MTWFRWLGWIVGVIVLVLAIAGVMAYRRVTAVAPGLEDYVARYAPAQRRLVTILAKASADLERIDPIGTPAPQSPTLLLMQEKIHGWGDAARGVERKAYRQGPHGFDPSIELEVAALRSASDAAVAQGVTLDEWLGLAREAHAARLIAGYSIPLLTVHSGQPSFRAVVSCRALPNARQLEKQRRALKAGLVPPNAPLDPLYPLAVVAITSPEGLGKSLGALGAMDVWTPANKLEIAYALGSLYWWGPAPDRDQLHRSLAEASQQEPMLALAALGGVTTGFNNMLLGNDAGVPEVRLAFAQWWGAEIEQPWIDAGVAAAEDPALNLPFEQIVQLGRCPAQSGYLERLEPWSESADRGEWFFLRSYFAQQGYVGFLAREDPAEMGRIAGRAPYPDQRFNGLLFASYVEEVLRDDDIARPYWAPVVAAGLAGRYAETGMISRALGSPAAGDWQTLAPAFARYFDQLSQRSDVSDFEHIWPFQDSLEFAICPIPSNDSIDDPEFLRSIDADLRRVWDSATPAFRESVVASHLPRMLHSGLPLDGWKSRAATIAPLTPHIRNLALRDEVRAALGLGSAEDPDPNSAATSP
ncbi:MAG: hypothetical protein ABI743_04220 [bacterium]